MHYFQNLFNKNNFFLNFIVASYAVGNLNAKYVTFREPLQISLIILREFKRISYLKFPLKSCKNRKSEGNLRNQDGSNSKQLKSNLTDYPFSTCDNTVGIYLPKVNSRNTKARCEIYSKISNKDPRTTPRFGAFIVNFKHIWQLVLLFLLLTLNM